jgi:hypothetical protein
VLVGARTVGWYPPHGLDEERVADPFDGMGDADITALRGVGAEVWTEHALRIFDKIAPDRVVVFLKSELADEDKSILDALPRSLRYLVIEDIDDTPFKSLEGLNRFDNLTLLHLTPLGQKTEDMDLGVLSGLRSLKSLWVRGWELKGAEKLATLENLSDLRFVSGAHNFRLKTIDFVRGMPALTRLELPLAQVKDLTPLGGHPCLREVKALDAEVETLPSVAMPRLKRLDIPDATLGPGELERFKATHGHTQVTSNWNDTIADGLAGADALRVRTGGTCHIEPHQMKTLLWVRGVERVGRIIRRMDVSSSGYHCGCHGTPTMEFYRKGDLIAAISIHHGLLLRWPDHWPKDAAMSDEFAEFLVDWLAKNGIKEPKKERKSELEAREPVEPQDN